ncbi:hypothetical protein [Georgenia sp. SYP-B2076]|uniref:hypothetical protein n=1 Tax=Georgenia sp. SYP-B2076 TaxID=2495881 RepID=UPI001F0C2672|nr:hypothetical protein [Georgenia sp. SYP-B2076]
MAGDDGALGTAAGATLTGAALDGAALDGATLTGAALAGDGALGALGALGATTRSGEPGSRRGGATVGAGRVWGGVVVMV